MDARILKIVERWYLTEPAMFQIYCTHNLEQNSSMSCPFRCGKGKIEYNQELVNTLSKEEIEAYLKAEIIRILLKHPYDRQPDGCRHRSTSMGSNLVLSDNYDFDIIKMSKPSDFNLSSSESFEWYSCRMEEYYSSLQPCENSENGNVEKNYNQDSSSSLNMNLKNTDESTENGELEIQLPDGTIMSISSSNAKSKEEISISGGENAKTGNNDYKENKSIENRILKSDIIFEDLSALWEEDSVFQCAVDVAIDEIESTNGWGSLAGGIAQTIVANTRAKIDYRKVLAGFRASILSSKRQLTRMRPNRRSGFDNMGSIRRFDTNILVAVDVSGSVNEKTLAHFYSIINKAFKYGINHIDTIQFDTELKELQSFEKAQKNIHIFGRGGTSFQPIFDYVGTHREYDGLIIFTDGCAPEPIAPKRMSCKVVWVLNNVQNYESNKIWMKKTGRSCTMEI